MLNASAKHGSGWAQPAGVALLLYSILDIGIGRLRGVDDDTSSFLAGTLTGAIYRHDPSPSTCQVLVEVRMECARRALARVWAWAWPSRGISRIRTVVNA